MKNRIYTIVLLTLCFCLSITMTQGAGHSKDNLHFSHISINNGLSQNTIFAIAQDAKGYMWFATHNGVNKYDGYDFTIYQNNPQDSTTIANDIIRTLVTDDKGRVWIGTESGLSYYNEERDIFENFYLKNSKTATVSSIVTLSDSQLLVNAEGQLYSFDAKSKAFSQQTLPTDLLQLNVTALYRTAQSIYIGTAENGVFVWDYKGKRIQRLSLSIKHRIQALLLQNPSTLWIATEGEGLYRLNPQTGEQKHYVHSYNEGDISSNFIRALSVDTKGYLWIGTFNDLNVYHESSDKFTAYTHNPIDPESLSQRSVRCIYKDSQGGMWLGTYFGGINYYHPLKNRFRNIQRLTYKKQLNDNVVSCIVEDSKHNLYIGTNDGGVNYYDPHTDECTYYTFNNKQSPVVESNNVKCISIDEKRNVLYIGTHAGGIKILHRAGGNIEHCYSENNPAATQNIYSLLPYKDNMLWAGTLDGLYLFNKDSKTFTAVDKDVNGNEIQSEQINILFQDSKRRLWIGGKNSLSVYKITDNGLKAIKISIDGFNNIVAVQDIHEDEEHCLWFCTQWGLYKLDREKHVITHYTTKNGLPNNVIYGIEEDSYHHLWLSTNHGLSCLNPSNGQFRNFSVNDGLQSNQFNPHSHCRTADGSLYFGGINGISTFRPELLTFNPFTPKPFFTKFYLYNKEVHPGDESGILSKNISDTEKIVLKPSQRAFTLEFVVTNFISGQHNTFSYQLEGYDKEWYYLKGHQRSVLYSNLPAGKYRFLVKAANNDGHWNGEPAMLTIKVLPVWYATWWAILLFFIIIVALIAIILRYFWERKSMEARLKMEQKEKLHQEEIAQMKMRFFINISHELRTPLTLILAPIQDMLAKTTDKWMKEQLNYVNRNANRLLNLVNQLMDYRRAELGVFKLKVEHTCIYKTVKESFMFYEKLARTKNLEYTLISDIEDKECYADPKYVELILNNLLSNAFKYTEKGSITVRLTLKDDQLQLEVSDTGCGIEQDKHKRIFERFYQLKNNYVGSGIGLSLVERLVELHHGRIELVSEKGKGSIFTIYLPQNPNAYAENEFSGSSEDAEPDEVHSTNSKEMYIINTEKDDNTTEEDTDNKKGCILVVEDNEEIRHYLYSGLQPNFCVKQAANGAEALDILKDTQVDIVITDVMMPVMDGIKLCKQIKQNIVTSHIPVIILSAKTDVNDQMQAMQTGADDYIAKPFSLSVLIAKVQNRMRTRARMIEHYAKSAEVDPEKITFNAMDEKLLKRAVEVVKANMDNPEFSAEEFARNMNMSRSNLHLKLKGVTGESAIEFIRKIRFNEACRLLREGQYSISEISSMVGFNTPSYFSTVFKKYMGCLPTEYVKKGNR